MNMLYIKKKCVGFMVSEIPRVSVFGDCPYSVTFPYIGDISVGVSHRERENLLKIGNLSKNQPTFSV